MKYLSCAEETGRQEAALEMNQQITWTSTGGLLDAAQLDCCPLPDMTFMTIF